MLLYCLKCRHYTESEKNKSLWSQKTEEQCFYHNVQCVIIGLLSYL